MAETESERADEMHVPSEADIHDIRDMRDTQDKQQQRPAPAAQHAHMYAMRTLRVRRPRWAGYTAFVLSGGGARGALQVGALRALLEHGERPDVIVGTSIGAWNGAVLARNPTLTGVEELADIWHAVHSWRVT